MKRFITKNNLISALGLVFWLGIWQMYAVYINQEILLVSPVVALKTLFLLLLEGEFWRAVATSMGNILGGFGLALLFGCLLAYLAAHSLVVKLFLRPLFAVIQASPVASFIILALIWLPSRRLSLCISFFMALPIVYGNLLTGFLRTDTKLLEMARVFGARPFAVLRLIYLPQMRGYLYSAMTLALGFCFKSGIAAEVISLPKHSLGGLLYSAKIALETPTLFALTLGIVLLNLCMEKLLLLALRGVGCEKH